MVIVFERRVIKHLEKQGYHVTRSGKSKFPDGIAIKKYNNGILKGLPKVVIFECKVRKYLSKKEKEEAQKIFETTGIKLTVYWRDGRKLMVYTLE